MNSSGRGSLPLISALGAACQGVSCSAKSVGTSQMNLPSLLTQMALHGWCRIPPKCDGIGGSSRHRFRFACCSKSMEPRGGFFGSLNAMESVLSDRVLSVHLKIGLIILMVLIGSCSQDATASFRRGGQMFPHLPLACYIDSWS